MIVDIVQKTRRPVERLAWFDPPSNPGSTLLMHRQPDDVWRIDYQIRDDEDPAERSGFGIFKFSPYFQTSAATPGADPTPYIDRAWAGALTLIILVMVLNLLGRFIAKRFAPKLGR